MAKLACAPEDADSERGYVPAREAAKAFDRTPGTLKRWCRAGSPHQVGSSGEYLVNVAEVRRWLGRRQELNKQARHEAARQAAEETQAPPTAASTPSSSPPLVDDPDPSETEPPEPPRRHRRPRSPAPRPGRSRPPEPAAPANSEPPDPALADLRRASAVNRLWSGARSLTVKRLISEDGEAERLGAEGAAAYVGFDGAQLQEAISSGGIPLLLQRELGPGEYEVACVGPGGAPLPPVVVTVPNLRREYLRHQAQEEEAERRERTARREKRLAQAAAKKRAAREAQAARLSAQRWQAENAWAQAVAAVGVQEGVLRLRFRELQLTGELSAAVQAYGRRQASLGAQARRLAREVERLRRRRDRTKSHVQRLLEARNQPDVDLDFDDDEQEVGRPATPRDPIPAELTAPLEAELARVRAQLDPEALQLRLVKHLLDNAPRLFPAPPAALVAELEPRLPTPAVGFLCWAWLPRPARWRPPA